jgi:hypothetical protein
MNKRIKELAEQAGYEKDMFGIGHWDMPECKKFAELMTHEFIGILAHEIALCEKYKATACNDFDRTWQQGKIEHFHKLMNKTKDHFGVDNVGP